MHSPYEDTTPGKLLKAGLQLFSEYGVSGVSIQQICRSAGISIGSAYHHFEGKQDVADTLLRAGLADNARQRTEALEGVHSVEESIKAVVYSLIDWVERNQVWAKYIYLVADSAHGTVLEQPDVGQQDLFQCLQPGIDGGEIRKLPAELLPSILLGPTHDCARRFLAGRITAPLQQYAGELAQVAWESLKVYNRSGDREA